MSEKRIEKIVEAIKVMVGYESITDEYFYRFILPHLEYAKSKGIPLKYIDEMFHKALDESTPDRLPGMILRDLIAEYEQKSVCP